MINTRLATPADIPRLADLLTELFTQEQEFAADRVAQTRGLALLFERGDAVRIVVAQTETAVIGMGVLHYTVSTYLGAKVAILEDVIVTAEERANGIGKVLMSALIARARLDGIQRITLLTDADNVGAQGFYERFGFARSTMLPYRLMLPETMIV